MEFRVTHQVERLIETSDMDDATTENFLHGAHFAFETEDRARLVSMYLSSGTVIRNLVRMREMEKIIINTNTPVYDFASTLMNMVNALESKNDWSAGVQTGFDIFWYEVIERYKFDTDRILRKHLITLSVLQTEVS